MTVACPTPKPLLPTRPVMHKPPKPILRLAGQAIEDYRMIRAGDRILLALSGGKDSLTLLHLLLHLRARSPVKFELAAATVDPCIDGFDPGYLKDYVPALGIPYFYRQEKIVERAGLPTTLDNCPACFRMPTERMHMKELLAAQEKHHPRLFDSLLAAMRPLMGEPPA